MGDPKTDTEGYYAARSLDQQIGLYQYRFLNADDAGVEVVK